MGWNGFLKTSFTSSVSIEKRVLSKGPRRSGPRESRSMAGSVGPSAAKTKSDFESHEKFKSPLAFCVVQMTSTWNSCCR